MKWILALVTMLLVLISAWWLVDSNPSASYVVPEPDSAWAGSSEVDAEELLELAGEPHVAAPEPPPSPVARAASAGGFDVFRGTVVLVERHGVETGGLDGRLRVSIEDQAYGFEVVAGEFNFEVWPGSRLEFERAELDGQLCRVEPGDRKQEPGRSHVVRVRRIPEATLEVIDALTGAELWDVDLVGLDEHDPRHPLSDGVPPLDLVRHHSPIALPENGRYARRWPGPPDPTYRKWWARTPGHGWGCATVDHARGGVTVLALKPTHAVNVQVRGYDFGTQRIEFVLTALGVEGEDTWEWRKQLVEDEWWWSFHGLPAGEYRIEATSRRRFNSSKLQVGSTLLAVGDRAVEEIVLDLERHQPCVVSGTLELCDSCPEAPKTLSFRSLDPPRWGPVHMTPLIEQPGGRACLFETSELHPGQWMVTAPELGFAEPITVPPGGRSDLHLRVHEPLAHVTVTVEGASHLDGRWLYVSWTLTRGGLPAGMGHVPIDDERAAEFRCASGTLTLQAHGAGWRSETVSFDVEFGRYETACTLERVIGLVLELQHDGRPVLDRQDFWHAIEFERLRGEGEAEKISSRGEGSASVGFTHEGRWRLSFPRLPGYRPIAPVELEIARGRAEHTIHVELE